MFRELFLLLFIATSIFSHSTVYAAGKNESNLGNALRKVVPAVKNAGLIDYKQGCATCAQMDTASNKRNSTILVSKDNDQKIELTVISEDDAASLFSEIAERTDIPFGYPMDGCYARAHKVVKILENQGVIAGKAFVEGELYVDTKFGEVGWSYHVAPVVMVKKGTNIIPYIFDPSLFSKPVPQVEWKAKMLAKSKAKFKREYFTNRFAYDSGDRTSNYDDYTEESLDDMDQTNRDYGRMLYAFEAKTKN